MLPSISSIPKIEPIAALVVLIFLHLPALVQAQTTVQVMEADSIVGGTVDGAAVQRILGNVHLQTEDMDMYADSAYKFDSRNLVRAFGNIEIDTQQENIFADTLTYYTDIDFSELRGRVIIESDSTTLFGNSVDYRFSNRVAHFRDEIRLEDKQGILRANSGFYFREADSATFRGQVQLRDSLQYIEGDSLFSNRQREYYELHGSVYANDPENETMLKGDYLEADSTGRRLIEGNAWLKNYRQDTTATQSDTLQPIATDSSITAPPDSARSDTLIAEPVTQAEADTTHIQARRILSLRNRMPTDTTNTIKAFENVRIWSRDFSSVSDTAQYESAAQTFELWSNAKAWHEQIQLSGPYIWVKLAGGDIRRLISHPNPFIVQQDTAINRLNQIKGDTLNAQFQDGQLDLMRVFRNSHLLRFTQKDGQPDGALDLRAPITEIYFENGQLVELVSLGNNELINGNYLPESEQIAKRRLDGFTWNPDQRPQEPKEPMQRRFAPIPEEPPFQLPTRYLEHIGRPDSLQTSPADTTDVPADSVQSSNITPFLQGHGFDPLPAVVCCAEPRRSEQIFGRRWHFRASWI